MSRKFFLCLISALLLAAPFHFPFLLPLAWIAFVPLFWALEGAKLREAFLFGWATGVVANLINPAINTGDAAGDTAAGAGDDGNLTFQSLLHEVPFLMPRRRPGGLRAG